MLCLLLEMMLQILETRKEWDLHLETLWTLKEVETLLKMGKATRSSSWPNNFMKRWALFNSQRYRVNHLRLLLPQLTPSRPSSPLQNPRLLTTRLSPSNPWRLICRQPIPPIRCRNFRIISTWLPNNEEAGHRIIGAQGRSHSEGWCLKTWMHSERS